MTYNDRLAIGRPLRASISITRYILSICFLNIFVEFIIDLSVILLDVATVATIFEPSSIDELIA